MSFRGIRAGGHRVLVAAFLATTAIGGLAATSMAAIAQQASGLVAFDIPAQPLAAALTRFGQQSGVQVSVDPTAAAGLISSSVSGSMSAETALNQLLAGTNLSYSLTCVSACKIDPVMGVIGI